MYHGPPKPTFLEVFMVNNMVFRWPKPLFFIGHGSSRLELTSWMLRRWFVPRALNPPVHNSDIGDCNKNP